MSDFDVLMINDGNTDEFGNIREQYYYEDL